MDRLFLDANVLFSAAFRLNSPIRNLWNLHGVELCTSEYAAGEAARNLQAKRAWQMDELHLLLARVQVAPDTTNAPPEGVEMVKKDLPILIAAIAAKATHPLTGDKSHFE